MASVRTSALVLAICSLGACKSPWLAQQSTEWIAVSPCEAPDTWPVSEPVVSVGGGDLDGDGHPELVLLAAGQPSAEAGYARARVLWPTEDGYCQSSPFDAWEPAPPRVPASARLPPRIRRVWRRS